MCWIWYELNWSGKVVNIKFEFIFILSGVRKLFPYKCILYCLWVVCNWFYWDVIPLTDLKISLISNFDIRDKCDRNHDHFHRFAAQFRTHDVHTLRTRRIHYASWALKKLIYSSHDWTKKKKKVVDRIILNTYVNTKLMISVSKCSSSFSLCSGCRDSSHMAFFKQLLSNPMLQIEIKHNSISIENLAPI